jgi:imidazolonepropionase-like amidohydrolase
VSRALHVRGVVLPDDAIRDVFVVDGRFTFVPPGDAETLVDGGYLLPGFVDAHAHLSLHSPAGDDAPAAARVRASAQAQLDAGVLAVREPGSPDRESVAIGPGTGLPRVLTGGRFLAPAGRYIPGLARETPAEELPAAAAEEVSLSGAWAKVIADFPGPGGVLTTTYPIEALTEAAARVHALGGRITAHATTPEAIEAVVTAGFDAVEHATFLRPDQVSELVARGTVIVPTLVIRDGILGMLKGAGVPADVVDGVRRQLDAQPEVVRSAAERGVPVMAGTDAGMVPHGLIGTEIRLLLAAGLPAADAIGAGSWRARSWLGLPLIEEGAPADLIAFDSDPRQDTELTRPRLVLLDGRVVAGTAA